MENLKRVLIVCSVHNETGRATAGALDRLLDRLRPDVLFLECSPTDFPAFQNGPARTLESTAIMLYRRRHDVKLEPVDLHLPDADPLKPKIDELFERIEAESPRYVEMDEENRRSTDRWGFAYLNSRDNALLEREMQREMRATVEAADDSRLTDLYELWTRINDQREQEMIRRVEAFARQTSIMKGVLLVGAAHRPSLIAKTQLPRNDGAHFVAWDDDWHHEIANPNGSVGPNGGPIDRGPR